MNLDNFWKFNEKEVKISLKFLFLKGFKTYIKFGMYSFFKIL